MSSGTLVGAVVVNYATEGRQKAFIKSAFKHYLGPAVIDQIIGTNVLYIIAAIVFILPMLSVQVRRLHDTGRTGWWWWIQLIPLIGTIVLIVFYLLDSEEGENQYGPNPQGGVSGSGAE